MRLKQIMETKGVSTSRLSGLSGLSETYIRLLLSERKSPTLRTLEKLAAALGVSVVDLLDHQPKAVGE